MMGMVEDYGKVILLKKEVIKRGGMSDHITDYTFKNTFALYHDLVEEVQRLENAQSSLKGFEEWLECTHDILVTDEDNIVIRFVFPYCG